MARGIDGPRAKAAQVDPDSSRRQGTVVVCLIRSLYRLFELFLRPGATNNSNNRDNRQQVGHSHAFTGGQDFRKSFPTGSQGSQNSLRRLSFVLDDDRWHIDGKDDGAVWLAIYATYAPYGVRCSVPAPTTSRLAIKHGTTGTARILKSANLVPLFRLPKKLVNPGH